MRLGAPTWRLAVLAVALALPGAVQVHFFDRDARGRARPRRQAAEDQGDMSEGLSLLEEGTRLFLKGLMAEMEPALRDLERVIEGLDAYEAPEVLPNGDIIIRRKRPLEPDRDIEVGPGGEVEL